MTFSFSVLSISRKSKMHMASLCYLVSRPRAGFSKGKLAVLYQQSPFWGHLPGALYPAIQLNMSKFVQSCFLGMLVSLAQCTC